MKGNFQNTLICTEATYLAIQDYNIRQKENEMSKITGLVLISDQQ